MNTNGTDQINFSNHPIILTQFFKKFILVNLMHVFLITQYYPPEIAIATRGDYVEILLNQTQSYSL